MPTTLALALLSIISGVLLTYLYDRRASLGARMGTGACTGYALLGSVGTFFASVWQQDRTLVASATVLTFPLALLVFRQIRCRVFTSVCASAGKLHQAYRRRGWGEVRSLIYYGFLVMVLWRVFDRVMFESRGEVLTAFVNNLGDLPFHLQVISSFVHGHNFPPEDPTYAGARFTYPFISDVVATMFVRSGASLRESMFVENMVLILALVGVLHRWTWELTRDRIACLLAPLLLLFGGGLGWVLFFQDAAHRSDSLLHFLTHPPRDYTLVKSSDFWRWGNPLTTLLVPQRALLLGLPVAVCIFTQWWLALQEEEDSSANSDETPFVSDSPVAAAPPAMHPRRWTYLTNQSKIRRMIAAGAMTGLLPLVHAHTFLAVMAVASCLALLFRRWLSWAVFFATAAVVAAPELVWLARGSVKAQSFLGWHIGWESGTHNLLWFWFVNTGAFIPLLVAALLWSEKKKYLVQPRLVHYYLPFMLCLIVPNLAKLAPWPWDNIKILIYWYLASLPFVAFVLAFWYRKNAVWRTAACVFFLVLVLAGALDIWRVIGGTTSFREFDRDQIKLAAEIRQDTPARALVLFAPTFNSPVFLTGRRSLLSYPGWAWSRGLDYAEREDQIRRIYRGDPDAQNLMRREHIDYVMIGPLERASMSANEAFFSQYVKVAQCGPYDLYKVSSD
jgi:hypothetical protein